MWLLLLTGTRHFQMMIVLPPKHGFGHWACQLIVEQEAGYTAATEYLVNIPPFSKIKSWIRLEM
jgi:hypothetical protein